MSLRREILPTDPEQLVELVLELAEENERLRAALKTINTMHFGAKLERIYAITKQQMALDLADLVTDASPLPANDDQPEATKAAPRRAGRASRHTAMSGRWPNTFRAASG